MIAQKNVRYFFLAILLLLAFCAANAQSIDEKTYQHKMQLMDSLSFYKMEGFDTLYRVSISRNFSGTDYKEDRYGWINKQSGTYILFLGINGKEYIVNKKEITGLKPLPFNQETIDSLKSNNRENLFSGFGDFASNYELLLWLYKKGKTDYSMQLLPQREFLLRDTIIRNGFGAQYYDDMLSAYSYERDYSKAITFGEHLSASAFKGYEYQKEAIALTKQLQSHPEDFKTFRLPDSVEWSGLKQKLTHKEQIIYLADRFRLLNCIQMEQPGGISYDMYQYSVPSGAFSPKTNAEYKVVNPFTELLSMKLSLQETKLLLPYLLTDMFIPSYNYHRDFFPERNLHRLSWVVESLIYEITNKWFFDRLKFDALAAEQKTEEVNKIKKWCDDNAMLSPEALTNKELKTASSWTDFFAALRTARQQKDDSLLAIIVQRFNDFNEISWQESNKGIMAQTMFEMGNEKYINTVRNWSRDTTDKWVNLWTSMFLIKYDKDSYEPAMEELEDVLKQCDGTMYYPHAMDLLLALNDKRALTLAECILDKSGFQRMISWDYYINLVRKLLLLKSDYTFKFLSDKLDAYTVEEMNNSHKDNDHMSTQNDQYVLAVDELKSDTPGYYNVTTNIARLAYITELDKWFKTHYRLLKQGKPNELRLYVKQVDAPVTYIDTYYR